MLLNCGASRRTCEDSLRAAQDPAVNVLPELLGLLLLATAVMVWQWLRQAHEMALALAQQACKDAGLQWLDNQVSLQSARLVRDRGQLRWQLDYQFDVSAQGTERRHGRLRLLAGQLAWIEMPTASGTAELWIPPDAST